MSDNNNDDNHTESPKPRINLTLSHVAGSSLAASSSALVASYLGVAGTIAGAAIGSAIATTGTAVYGHAFKHSGRRIAERLNTPAYVAPASRAQAASGAASQGPTWTQTELPIALPVAAEQTRAPADGESPTSQPAWRSALRKRVTLVVAMAAAFGIAITIGLLAGGPIRQAGTGYNFTRPQTAISHTSATHAPTGSGSTGPTTSPSAGASATAATPGPGGGTSTNTTVTPSQGTANTGAGGAGGASGAANQASAPG
jgi:hypothetical protein